MAFREGTSAAPGARGGPLPVVRDAGQADTGPALAVYSACIAADPGYLPFLAPGDEAAILGWFRLKPLLAFLIAELDGTVAGVAGLRDAEPGPGAGQPGGRWLEACRLAVHPAHRGGAVTRDLIRTRACRAAALGADRLWMRCVENSPSHRLALSHGWTWWAAAEFEGPAPASGPSCWPARSVNGRPGVRDRDRAPSGGARPACQARLKTATVPGRA